MTTMRASEERIKAVRAILDMARADGCECWIMERNCIGACWGLIGTPRGNLLNVFYDQFEGYTFTLRYHPNSKTGRGCQCLKKGLRQVAPEDIREAEREGIAFAKKLRANLYTGLDDALSDVRDLGEYIKL